MGRNVELKARVHDLEALGARVISLGATGPEMLVQIDTFFIAPSGRLKLREFEDQTGELIHYRRPDTTGPKLSEYFRTAVPSCAALREILAQSLGVQATVRKRRAVFILGSTRIHLDDVQSLGTFIEFEVVLRDGQSVAEGHDVALGLLNALSIPNADLIATAYVDLILERDRQRSLT